MTSLTDVAIIKVTYPDDTPFAVLFNYPVHPTVLKSQNRLFSADFVGYAREHLRSSIGNDLQPIYFNGAQGDILPVIFNNEDRFDACDRLAAALADTVKSIWDVTNTSSFLDIAVEKMPYSFQLQSTPFCLNMLYESEINLIALDKLHAFITIPGELSCLYDMRFKEMGHTLGFLHTSIFGLTNDAHGYIILPESWQHKTFESGLSFGGEYYGDTIEKYVEALLINQAPISALKGAAYQDMPNIQQF